MAKERNIGVYRTDDEAFEGDWGDQLTVEGIPNVASRGVGGGFYHLHLSGTVTAGTYQINRKRGLPPEFLDLKTPELEVSGSELIVLNSGELAAMITIALRN